MVNQKRISRIQASTIDKNIITQKLLEKLGFQYEGRKVNALKLEDNFHDELMYAYLIEENYVK